jgi:hypothetical protein
VAKKTYTPEEKAAHKAAFVCKRCNKKGHYTMACPDKPKPTKAKETKKASAKVMNVEDDEGINFGNLPSSAEESDSEDGIL